MLAHQDVRSFFDNIWTTIGFAFFGTFLSTFVVGSLVWGAGQIGLCYPMSLLASLTFGSVISATDPITVLAVFQARPPPSRPPHTTLALAPCA